MKRKNRFLFFILFSCSVSTASAQESVDRGTATLDANYCLNLETEGTLRGYYVADISAFGFDSEIAAQKAFGMRSNNLITYTVVYAENKVIAQLHLDRTGEPKDLKWWNAYLRSVCETY